MKLLIDNSNLFAGGGLQVAASFLRDLKRLPTDDEFVVVNSVKCTESLGNEDFPRNFKFYRLTKAEETSKRKRIRKVLEIENEEQPDIIFTLFGPSYHKSGRTKVVGLAIPYIIYPKSPFLKNISLKEKIYYKLLALLKTYSFKRNSDALIFETESARRIFTEKYNYSKPTYTVGNTLNEIFGSPQQWEEMEGIPESAVNILFLTANYPHKNMKILPEMISILKNEYGLQDFQILLTLQPEDVNFPEETNAHITYLGRVPLQKIPSLYRQSHLVLIPTLLEIFSTTYLEAMFMKKPIIASDMPFARDICGNSAYFCAATDPASYAEAVVKLHRDAELRKRLTDMGTENLKRFGSSMDRTKAYLKIINQIYESNSK